MALGATLSARKFLVGERLPASIIAAGKPLPQKRSNLLESDALFPEVHEPGSA
jgi:hypothetical protein